MGTWAKDNSKDGKEGKDGSSDSFIHVQHVMEERNTAMPEDLEQPLYNDYGCLERPFHKPGNLFTF
jgi:hypothetical protein